MTNETVDVCDELSYNFLESSYDVNCNRSFPSALDGLKPSQRAILFTMHRKGYLANKPHVKSAKVSGAVCAELHPHGRVG